MKIPKEIFILTRLDEPDFTQIDFDEINGETERALKVNGEWLPKSQLRQDMEGNLYLAHWLYEQKGYRE